MKLRVASVVAALLMCGAPAFSQGCAMCYSSAAAASKDGQRAISKAVLVLVIPPAGFMTIGIGVARWYAKKRDQENS